VASKQKLESDDPAAIPGAQLTCRVLHDWPYDKMQETKKLLPGVWTELVDAATNLWRLFDRCARCGSVRWRDLPGKRWDRNGRWQYKRPREIRWVTMLVQFTKGDAREEVFNRNASKLFPEDET
jgi:hypothetical protein